MRLGVDFNILNQKGTPAFYSDVFANRPAAGFAGRVFISTDTGAIYEDTGSTWTLIADAGAGTTGTLQQVTTNGNTTTNAITVQGINLGSGNNNIAQNTGLGTSTLNAVTTGGGNTAIGYTALQFNTGGQANTAVGNIALNAVTTGNGNTAIGSQTLPSNNGDRNTAIGYQAGTSITTGSYNTIIGNYVGSSALSNNTVLADGAGNIRFIDNNGSAGITGSLAVGGQSIPTGFTATKFYAGLTSPLESHIYSMGVVGTATGNSGNTNIWGVGVYGAGYTNGATRSAGVQGDGEVSASGDTGSAIGVRGYATATHSGGLNIGILGDATGSGTGNYGFYTNMASGANTFANFHAGTAINYYGGDILAPNILISGGLTSTDIRYNGYGFITFDVNNVGTNDFQIRKGISPYTTLLTLKNNGNLLINTLIDSGYKLNVDGIVRFQKGALISNSLINSINVGTINALSSNTITLINGKSGNVSLGAQIVITGFENQNNGAIIITANIIANWSSGTINKYGIGTIVSNESLGATDYRGYGLLTPTIGISGNNITLTLTNLQSSSITNVSVTIIENSN